MFRENSRNTMSRCGYVPWKFSWYVHRLRKCYFPSTWTDI